MRADYLLPLAALCLTGCTAMTPVEMPPEELRQMILTENVLPPGETARVVTEDGKVQKFRVVEVDTATQTIRGKDVIIDVDDVVAVETREFSMGKTAVLATGTYFGLYLLVGAIGGAFLL